MHAGTGYGGEGGEDDETEERCDAQLRKSSEAHSKQEKVDKELELTLILLKDTIDAQETVQTSKLFKQMMNLWLLLC